MMFDIKECCSICITFSEDDFYTAFLPSCLFEIEYKKYLISLRRKFAAKILPVINNLYKYIILYRRMKNSISGWIARVGYKKKVGK